MPIWIRKAKQIGLMWDDMNKLKKEKWEVIAKVKEGNETVQVSMLLDQDLVRGLFVMVAQEHETFLVNVLGQIDFEKLGELLENLDEMNLNLDLPQLEKLKIEAESQPKSESKQKVEDK